MTELRIVSFLPAATEMVAELGLEDALVGISDECDWPPSIRNRPVVTKSVLHTALMPPAETDDAVRRHLAEGRSLYAVDEALLAELRPTHILTQDLCQVCAPSGNELQHALAHLPEKPEVIWLSPQTLTDIAQNLRDLSRAFGRQDEAEAILIAWKARMDEVQARASGHAHVRCFVMEWADPIYCSGHWVAEMVQLAGGYDLLSRPGRDSVRVSWDEVRAEAPQVLIIAPCGYDLDRASSQLPLLEGLPGWEELPAVRSKRVYAVNANAFLTRPGPRVVDGIEMLFYLLHGNP
ncbi:MAG: cobalamin-binding protein [Alphaproteobacteria bacterium]|nr:cobalamin-binding protein [Alphaproteobacteria bacterium]